MKQCFFLLLLLSCSYHRSDRTVYQNEGHRLVAESVAKTGNYKRLKSLVDVTFDYTFKSPDGKV